MRARKLVVGLISLALVAAPLTRLPAFAAPKGECPELAGARGPWVSLNGPRFGSGGSGLSGFAFDPMFATGFFIATNGTEVWEGPCDWQKSFAATDSQTIADMEIARGSARGLLLVDETNALGAHVPHVFATSDAGGEWAAADVGLPPTGRPVLVRSSQRDAQIFYLVLELQQGAQVLYASTDGGSSWEPRSQDLTNLVGRSISSLEVDPMDPKDIWAAGETGLYHSTDGGNSFTAIPEFAGTPSGPIDIFHGPGEPARLLVFRPGESDMMSSEDGGEGWLVVRTPGAGQSVAHGAVSEAVLASFAGKIYVYSPDVIGWNLLDAPRTGILDLQSEGTPQPSFFGRTGTTIEMYRGVIGRDIQEPDEVVDLPDVSINDGAKEVLPDPKLHASAGRLRLKPGKSATVAYDLDLATARTPLDLFFLVDSTSTMQGFIGALRLALADITNELIDRKLDVHFGLGEYRAYPDFFPPRQDEPNFVYRLRDQIGPTSDGSLQDAINQLETEAGGQWTATLGALHSMATGEPQDVFPPGPSDGDVPPNLDAEFRKNALRAVLVVTNDFYKDADGGVVGGRPQPNIPDAEEVADDLARRGIRQVAIQMEYHGHWYGVEDAQGMAAATHALAPDGGVDCDGDGRADIAPKAPLVCRMSDDQLETGVVADPIVALTEAIRSRADMGFVARGNQRFIEEVTPSAGYPGSALNAHDRFRFEVTYRCPVDAAGEAESFTLDATRDDDVLDSAAMKVVCVAPKESDFASIPPDIVLALVPLLPAPPPPPLPNLATSAQAQSQAQAQAHAAFAAQEEEQPQTAFVHAFHAQKEQAAESYQMSRYRDRSTPFVPPGAFVASVGALMALAFGASMALRERLRLRTKRW